ncbi:MAG TPA: hypothetical protein VEQ59_09375 [Polyangiaceae bacterium]|nr:hypothetical protein [Polyangiaceae bacterium]
MKKMTILRWSLLAAIGLLPLACSSDDDEAPQNTGGKAGSGGTAGSAGTGGKGGTSGSAGKDSGGAGVGTLGGAGGSDAGAGGVGHKPLGKPPTCTSPEVGDDGITTCKEGYHYREKPVACAFRADQGPDAGGAGGAGGASAGGADGSDEAAIAPRCSPACEGEHAYCRAISATPIITVCSRGCLTDDECGTNELCQCDGSRGGVCVPASCRGDADCDDGYHCAQAQICTGLNTGSFACQSPEDECVTEKDCDHASCGLDFPDESHRVCYEGLSCG